MNHNKIVTTHKGLFLEIDLGNACTYRCSYCPCRKLDGEVQWINYERMMHFIKKSKAVHVLLGGGEPTLYPEITELLKDLSSKNIVIDVITNAARSIQWWKDHIDYFDIITVSYHLEFTNIISFTEKLELMTDKLPVTINLPMIPERFDDCLKIAHELIKTKNTFVSLKALTDYESGELYQYNDDQLDLMSTVLHSDIKTKSNKNSIEIFWEDGDKTEKITAQKLISNNENRFEGWKCNKGIDYMRLKYDGSLYRSACELSESPFANMFDKTISYPDSPSVCNREHCMCLTDLKTINKENR